MIMHSNICNLQLSDTVSVLSCSGALNHANACYNKPTGISLTINILEYDDVAIK